MVSLACKQRSRHNRGRRGYPEGQVPMEILAAHAWLQQQCRSGCLGVWSRVAHRSTWGNAGNMGGELSVMVVTGQCCLFTPGCTQSPRGCLYIGLNRKLSVCTVRIIHCFVWQRWQTWAGGGGIQTHHKSHASVLDFSCGG